MTILIISSHPNNTNGYSKVVYNICKHITDEVYIYGCQVSKLDHNRILPQNVHIFDVSKNEIWNNKDENGFNFDDVGKFINIIKPKCVLIYNDSFVCFKFIEKIILYNEVCKYDFQFKIVLYLDLVYPFIKQIYVNCFNMYVHSVIVCHEYWNEFLMNAGIKCNLHVLRHGCNAVYKQSRLESKKGFRILNLNRNTLRKRLDVTIRSFVYALKRSKIKLKLLIKEPQENDAWDVVEIFQHEMPNEQVEDHITFIKNYLSDLEIDQLYDQCDIGLNTCEGEGFGLCNYEHACHGRPQIIPEFDQFHGLYPVDSILTAKPKHDYYIENRDAIGGIAKVVDYVDVGECILQLTNSDKYNEYCQRLSEMNPKSYKEISELFMKYIK